MWLATPPAGEGKTARDLGIDLGRRIEIGSRDSGLESRRIPNPFHESRPVAGTLAAADVAGRRLGCDYLARYFSAAGDPLNALNLNILNLAFLLVGFLLHRTPARLMRAFQEATPAVWGVILQFPFYAGIAGIITATHLNERLAAVFVRFSTAADLPGPRRRVLRRARRVRAVGRIEVGDRSAVRDGGRAHAEGSPRLGGLGVRPRRSAGQPGAAVLDAAGAGTVQARGPAT